MTGAYVPYLALEIHRLFETKLNEEGGYRIIHLAHMKNFPNN